MPKFGDWDINDPSCGVGFTAVFERAANEKTTGGCAHVSPKPSTFRSSSKKVETLYLLSFGNTFLQTLILFTSIFNG